MQESSTNLFLFVDLNEKRDNESFYVNFTDSNEGTFDFEIGLNKCPFSYYALIKQSFFEQYPNFYHLKI